MKLNRLIPMLPVRSMPATSRSSKTRLHRRAERRRWRWAMLCLDDCRLMLDESINVHPAVQAQPFSTSIRMQLLSITSKCEGCLVVPDLDFSFYGMTEFRSRIDGIGCGLDKRLLKSPTRRQKPQCRKPCVVTPNKR